MIELPEAQVLARQINETISGKHIAKVTAAQTPHKFAWFYGDPQEYNDLLAGQIIGSAQGFGGMVEVTAGNARVVFGDGVGIRYHKEEKDRPVKHQLLIELTDSSAISASVQMYGGMWCFSAGEFDNPYYQVAQEKPSPLSQEFNEVYFDQLISDPQVQKLSAKAVLATEQRIPGLGNGVLQDILWQAKIHPKRKINTLTDEDQDLLLKTLKSVLAEMITLGGRDTEKDLFGRPGGYITQMSKNTAGKPCPVCGAEIKKEAYMGGSVYYCAGCQHIAS